MEGSKRAVPPAKHRASRERQGELQRLIRPAKVGPSTAARLDDVVIAAGPDTRRGRGPTPAFKPALLALPKPGGVAPVAAQPDELRLPWPSGLLPAQAGRPPGPPSRRPSGSVRRATLRRPPARCGGASPRSCGPPGRPGKIGPPRGPPAARCSCQWACHRMSKGGQGTGGWEAAPGCAVGDVRGAVLYSGGSVIRNPGN